MNIVRVCWPVVIDALSSSCLVQLVNSDLRTNTNGGSKNGKRNNEVFHE